MSGILHKTCCCSSPPPSCDFGNVSWSCGSSQVEWSTIYHWNFRGEIDGTSLQTIGPFGNQRQKERYARGYVKTSLGGSDAAPYYTTTQVGDYGSDANGVNFHYQTFTPTTLADFSSTSFPGNAQIVGEWESNRWEAYGSGNVCGCSGLGHQCCDREIVTTSTLTANIDTSQIRFTGNFTSGRVRFQKAWSLVDITDFVSGYGDRNGCYSLFESNGWGFPTEIIVETREKIYEEGVLVSDTTTTETPEIKTLLMDHATVRWGNMEECDNWSGPEPQSWLHEESTWKYGGFYYRYDLSGTVRGMSHFGALCYFMERIMAPITNSGFSGSLTTLFNNNSTPDSDTININFQPHQCDPPLRGNQFAATDSMFRSEVVDGTFYGWTFSGAISYSQAHEHFAPRLYP